MGMAACANVPPEQLAADYDFGDTPTNAKAQIDGYFDRVLRDPESAIYDYDEGFVEVICHTFELRGTERQIQYAGWGQALNVNARNAFGGYTGPQRYMALFDGDVLWKVLDTGEFSIEGCALN